MVKRLVPIAMIAAVAAPFIASTTVSAQQFEKPWEFTPRDRRVAVALAIKQVEGGLLGPGSSTTHVENTICNGPSGSASATANFFCEIIRGDNNTSGDKGQASVGDQTSNNNDSTGSTVTQGGGTRPQGSTSALAPVMSALQHGR